MLVAGLLACAGAPGAAPPSTGAGTGAAPASAGSTAEPALALPAELRAPGATIMVGEIHGTREIPAFVARLVTALAADRPVVLGLEIRRDQVPSLDGFLASDGGAAARAALLRDPFWTEAYQDGRRSVAIAGLIEVVRGLRARGAPVELVCFDAVLMEAGTQGAREAAMAQNLVAARAAHPGATLIALAGNLHTRKAAARWMPPDGWMAMQMARAGVASISLDPRYRDGSAWVCTGATAADCGPAFMLGTTGEPGIRLERDPEGGHDGWFHVGAVTASPPAGLPALAEGLEARLAALGDGPSAHRARARRAHRDKDYAACAAALGRIDPAKPEDAYNQACCLALAGDKDAAFARLQFAISAGFSPGHAAGDADLASLRSDPRWPSVVKP